MKKLVLLVGSILLLGAGCAPSTVPPTEPLANTPAAVAPRVASPTKKLAPAPIVPVQSGPKTYTVTIQNNGFGPAELVIKAGDTVVWVNRDTKFHSIQSDVNLWNTGNISPGSSGSHLFPATGGYNYHDGMYPSLIGRVIVNQ